MVLENSKAYFFEQKKMGENYNFHDYQIRNYNKHLVVEGNWDSRFLQMLAGVDIEALSIVGIENDIDASFIKDFFPNIKQLFIKCNSILNPGHIFLLKHLEDFSFTCYKNIPVEFKLPASIKSFVIDWKTKYQIGSLPPSLEYLSMESAKGLEWKHLFSKLENLIKADIINCDIDCGNVLISLPKLRYLSLTNCRSVRFHNFNNQNTSLKFLYLTKVPVENIDWIKSLNVLDILILEGCGNIKDILPLKDNIVLRGLYLAGNTKIINGDLRALDTLTNLHNCFITSHAHYTHKSKFPWNWNNFNEDYRKMVERKKKA